MVKKRIKNEKVTISDVAKLSGVVPSTVSHVINGTAHISDETKERVLRAIEELNYSPNALARALRQKRTRLIGVVLQDISSEFYARCAASMLEEARKNNYIVLLCDASFQKENVKVGVSALIERRVDGLVFVGGGDDEDILQEAVSANVPVVLGDRDSADYPSVVFNNEETVRKLVCALYDSGYRKFVYAGEPLLIQNNLMARYNGYLEGIEMCGIPEEDHYEVLDEELHQIKLSGSYYHFLKLLKEKGTQKKQVVITSNDMIAHGLIAAALKLGIRVPEDLAVVGFDDIIISEFFQPPLTTIRQDAELLGKSCYELLKNVIHGKKNKEQIVLTQKVIVRESACIPEDILARYQ